MADQGGGGLAKPGIIPLLHASNRSLPGNRPLITSTAYFHRDICQTVKNTPFALISLAGQPNVGNFATVMPLCMIHAAQRGGADRYRIGLSGMLSVTKTRKLSSSFVFMYLCQRQIMLGWPMNLFYFFLPLYVSLHLMAAQSNAADRSAVEAPINQILEKMSEKHGFVVKGLSRVDGVAGSDGNGSVLEQIERLLADHNYILLRKPNGRVERLIISGRKRAFPPPRPRATVSTRRRGRHHIVQAVIRGPNGSAVTTGLMVDTGASTVVLPSSMIAKLGFARNQLRKARMKTANRTVEGRIGVLTSVDIAGHSTTKVRVAFVDDGRLQGARLLGMSFLRHFRVTIDDANNQITLVRNE